MAQIMTNTSTETPMTSTTTPMADTPLASSEPAPLTFAEVVASPDGIYFVVGSTRSEAWAAFRRIQRVDELACTHLTGLATHDRTRMVGYVLDVDEVGRGHLEGWLQSPIVIAVTPAALGAVGPEVHSLCQTLPDADWYVLDEPVATS